MASPSKSTTTRSVWGSASLSFKDLMTFKGKGKVSPSSLPPPAPKSQNKKRKASDYLDLTDAHASGTVTLDSALMGVLIHESVERESVDENFEAVSVVAWMIIQHARSGHDKMRRFLTEAQTKVSKADEKIDSLTAELKESKDTCASLAAELAKVKGELSSAKEECGHVAMELGSYFGGKVRQELMEEHAVGKQDEWDLDATRQEFEKEYPDGCLHVEYLRKVGLVGNKADEGEKISSRNDSVDTVDQGATGHVADADPSK